MQMFGTFFGATWYILRVCIITEILLETNFGLEYLSIRVLGPALIIRVSSIIAKLKLFSVIADRCRFVNLL